MRDKQNLFPLLILIVIGILLYLASYVEGIGALLAHHP